MQQRGHGRAEHRRRQHPGVERTQPALGGVYKLSAIRSAGGAWQYKLKLSEQAAKVSNPVSVGAIYYFLPELTGRIRAIAPFFTT